METDPCYWLYMLECENGSLYTGYTKDLAVRYRQHRAGKQSAKFTRSFKPSAIAGCWKLFDSKGTALKVERFIKNQDRVTKKHWLSHPDELKKEIRIQLDLELNLVPWDAAAIEMEAARPTRKRI